MMVLGVVFVAVGVGALSTPSNSDPSYRRAWKAVTSGGGPTEKKGPLTPEEREKEWAAKIIENHQRQKNVQKIKNVVDRVSVAVETPPPPKEDKRQKMLMDVFDGRLGKVKLSLRSSAEAMLTIVGEFDAYPTKEPGVVEVRGGGGDECLVDAKRCSKLEFVQRGNQYAITMKRLDDSSFLSVLLDSPTQDAVNRWLQLKSIYEGTNLSRTLLVPEGGNIQAKNKSPVLKNPGPLRPQGGNNVPSTPSKNPSSPLVNSSEKKREVKPKKTEVLIPRID